MSMESDLVARLIANAGVTALVASRIYGGVLQQNSVLPALVYNRISSTDDVTTDQVIGFAEARVQITCWAPSYSVAESVAGAVRAALHGFRGAMGSTTVHGVMLTEPGIRDDYEPETTYYRRDLDFLIQYAA